MKNRFNSEWLPLDSIDFNDSAIMQIHCDTRDFHCLIHDYAIDVRDGKAPLLKKAYYKPEFVIPQDKIGPWLKGLKKLSGGERDWRLLNFNNVNCGNWLKYIRIYKVKDKFIVCNRNTDSPNPIEWEKCNEENYIKENYA